MNLLIIRQQTTKCGVTTMTKCDADACLMPVAAWGQQVKKKKKKENCDTLSQMSRVCPWGCVRICIYEFVSEQGDVH